MTILFVTHYAGFYGANKSLLTLMVLLRERHGILPIVLLPNRGAMCAMLEEQGIEYMVSPYYWWVNYNHGLFQWALNKRKQWINWHRAKRIGGQLKARNIDLVYSNSVCVNIGFLVAKCLGLPHVWQFRESLTQFSLSLSKCLSKRFFADKTNRRYLLISDYMMSFYRPYLPHERMVRVYNGLDLPQGVARREENRINQRLQVACVGVICEQKNQMELLRAQCALHKRGIDIDTWLVGTCNDKAYLNSIQDYANDNGLAGMTHFVGHVDKVFEVLQKMNLGVVTAHDEAFGRVTIEYMLMKMPVIVSRSGASPELVKSGQTGLIYELGDVEALADGIQSYCSHPDLLVSQGEAAFSDAIEHFSAGNNAEHIYNQIVEVLSSK